MSVKVYTQKKYVHNKSTYNTQNISSNINTQHLHYPAEQMKWHAKIISGRVMLIKSMLCTTVLAANSGSQLYFSEKITFIEPHGKAVIKTAIAFVLVSIGKKNITNIMIAGHINNRKKETKYALLSTRIRRIGIGASPDPTIIIDNGTVNAPISVMGVLISSGI